jgi:DNA-binding transcriptional LysR family regulator
MRGSDFAELRAFAMVIEQGSFTRAAAHLGISPPALSQIIRNLEQRLGVRLINRTTRSVAASAAGERLMARLGPVLQELDAAVIDIRNSGDRPAGMLRINAARIAVLHFLAPLMTRFHQLYPDITVELRAEDAITDIVAEGFDAGIRLGESLDRDMVALPISGEMELAAVASPDYFVRRGRPLTPQDLHGHACIAFRKATDGSLYRWEFERDGNEFTVAVDGAVIVNDAEIGLRLAADGLGICYILDFQAAPYRARGDVERVLADWSPRFPGLYLYYPSRRQMPPALRAFIDFVRDSSPWTIATAERRS